MEKYPEIPGYDLKAILGEGGAAIVFLGIEEHLNRKVAIKVLDPQLSKDEKKAQRFLKEAHTATMLSHSNIIQIYNFGQHEHHHYLVMEYLEESLKERQSRAPNQKMLPEIALDIVETLMGALDYAHLKNVLHRDIKPENILFRQDGTPVLADFGIAKIVGLADSLTKEGITIGTAHYMSPEQCRAQKNVDGRSDIYSLGVVLYEMLTGTKPYDAGTQVEVALMHVEKPVPKLPEELKRYQPLIDRMMAKNKKDRLSSGAQLIQLMDTVMLSDPAPNVPLASPSEINAVQSDSPTPNANANKTNPLPAIKGNIENNIENGDYQNNNDSQFLVDTKTAIFKAPASWVKPAILALLVLIFSTIVFLSFFAPRKPPTIPPVTSSPNNLETRFNNQIAGKNQAMNIAQQLTTLHIARLSLESGDYDKASEMVTRLKSIYNSPQLVELEKKIIDARIQHGKFADYLKLARRYYDKKNFKQALSHIALAEEIKTSESLEKLKDEIARASKKSYNNRQRAEKRKADDQKAYQEASSLNTISSFKEYLAKYPQGSHTPEAKKRLAELVKIRELNKPTTFRSIAKTVGAKEVEAIIKRYNFFEKKKNASGAFENRFEYLRTKSSAVVIDHKANLIWYDGPLPKRKKKMTYGNSKKWLQTTLNANSYAGYNDWRFPTLTEAASLLKKPKDRNALHIDTIFATTPSHIWTQDNYTGEFFWTINFKKGLILPASKKNKRFIRPVRSLK